MDVGAPNCNAYQDFPVVQGVARLADIDYDTEFVADERLVKNERWIMEQNDPNKWDIPEILRRLVSPLAFFGLVVVVVAAFGYGLKDFAIPPYMKMVGICMAFLVIGALASGVLRRIRDAKDLVLDVNYHRMKDAADFIDGNTLTDGIDDRVYHILSLNGLIEQTEGEREKKQPTLTMKRIHEELQDVGRS